ncbi:MAG TPA: uracil-DNA glycosylase family protein, partial [Methylomirabilota bacterium]|nr:uracil-DNA glycosylase family protein [Methylomirabilota bacterium]
GEEAVHGKQSRAFAYGDVVSFQQSGAGGYGDPLARDPARVLEDVLDDYVSVDAARTEYGVVITRQDDRLTIDEGATQALRARRQSTSSADRYACESPPDVAFPGVDRPPNLYAYPRAEEPVEIIFIGWNPPRPFGGFWSDPGDRLRRAIFQSLRDVGVIGAESRESDFVEDFLRLGFYFLHAVKCWSRPRYPGFGRDVRNRRSRRILGQPLLKICASCHLKDELDSLRPSAVCALGDVPFRALQELYPDLRQRGAGPLRFRSGRCYEPNGPERPFRLLVTCLPLGSRSVRESFANHLRSFLGRR